jgi:hypothetical protein
MLFRYGSYTHPAGRAGVTVQRQALRNEAEQYMGFTETWDVNLQLISRQSTEAAARADIKAQHEAVAAQLYDDRDATVFFPNGTTRSHLYRPVSSTTGGIQVDNYSPAPNDYQGASGVTYSSLTFTLRCVVPAANSRLMLVSFEETVEVSPAGRKIGHLETKIGIAQPQTLRQHQIWRYRQTGSAVGFHVRPSVPPPIWPGNLVNSAPQVTFGHPKRIKNAYINWPISWSYDFESALPLIGVPHIWGLTY